MANIFSLKDFLLICIPIIFFLVSFKYKTKKKKIIGIVTSFILFICISINILCNVFVNISIGTSIDKVKLIPDGIDVSFIKEENNEDNFIIKMQPYIEERYVESSKDNKKIYYYILKNQKNDTNKYIVTVHGILGTHKQVSYYSEIFYNLGYNIITLDLRGYGKSEGDYFGLGILDAEDLVDVIKDFNDNYKNTKIALFGVSMGAATVLTSLDLDMPSNVKCIIEDSGYTGVASICKYQLQNMLGISPKIVDIVNPSVKEKAKYSLYDNSSIQGVKNTDRPTLFIHGKQDMIVPYGMCVELYNSCNAEKELFLTEDCGHTESGYNYKALYTLECKEFLKKYL